MPKKANDEKAREMRGLAQDVKNLMQQQSRAVEKIKKLIDTCERNGLIDGTDNGKIEYVKNYCDDLMTVVTTANVLAASLIAANQEMQATPKQEPNSKANATAKAKIIGEVDLTDAKKKPEPVKKTPEADEDDFDESFFDE